jgi:hypothetical protein
LRLPAGSANDAEAVHDRVFSVRSVIGDPLGAASVTPDPPSRQTARPCGCKSGAAFTLAALVGWPVWIAISGVPHNPIEIGTAPFVYAGVVIGAGVAGKLAGIAVGRARHRRLRHRFERRLTGVPTDGGT